MSGAADLGSAARAQRNGAAPEAETEAPKIIEAITAFMIFTKKDDKAPTGYQISIATDINVPVKADRQPTTDEILMYMHIVEKDITGQQFAGMAAQANLQMNQFVGQQLAAQQQLEGLGELHL